MGVARGVVVGRDVGGSGVDGCEAVAVGAGVGDAQADRTTIIKIVRAQSLLIIILLISGVQISFTLFWLVPVMTLHRAQALVLAKAFVEPRLP